MIRKIPLICNEIALFMEERADARVEWSLSKSFQPLVHQTRPFRARHPGFRPLVHQTGPFRARPLLQR